MTLVGGEFVFERFRGGAFKIKFTIEIRCFFTREITTNGASRRGLDSALRIQDALSTTRVSSFLAASSEQAINRYVKVELIWIEGAAGGKF